MVRIKGLEELKKEIGRLRRMLKKVQKDIDIEDVLYGKPISLKEAVDRIVDAIEYWDGRVLDAAISGDSAIITFSYNGKIRKIYLSQKGDEIDVYHYGPDSSLEYRWTITDDRDVGLTEITYNQILGLNELSD